jgi:Skp family chaperone for outer membrane proteins
VALALAFQPLTAGAQSNQSGSEWFVPKQRTAPAPATRAPAPAAPRAAVPVVPPGGPTFSPEAAPEHQIPQKELQAQLPPAPEVPDQPKSSPPPAAIIGILSIPDVLRVSTAYQEADKEMGQRRQKLNEDAQKEQVSLRDLGQALANERAKLSPEQIRTKERELQDRISESRRKFGERNRIIQEAGQYVMAQIDRTLEQVAQKVAIGRGVNIVLNRAQILGTTADFDLTPQVAEVLNKVLPSVVIPPDGVSPLAMNPPGGNGQKDASGSQQNQQGGAKPAAAQPAKSRTPAQKH